MTIPGYPMISYRVLPGDHLYRVYVQTSPRAAAIPIGEVARYGSLPSMRRWKACGNWPGSEPTRSRQQRGDAAADLLAEWRNL